MANHSERDEPLRDAPLITLGALGRANGVGDSAVEAAARRLGISGTRRGNGRKLLSFRQALEIAQALTDRAAD